MKLAIIDCDDIDDGVRSRFLSYPHMFVTAFDRAVGPFSYQVFNALERQLPHHWCDESLSQFDGWLILGSKYGVYESYPWIDELRTFVGRLVATNQKLAGICFGHQMIHHSLGGKVEKSLRGWGVGVHKYQLVDCTRFGGGQNDTLSLLASHQDQVEVAAPGSRLIARSDFCPNAICEIGTNIFTCQPHPEFNPEYARILMTMREGFIPAETLKRALASLDDKQDNSLVLCRLADFWR